MPAGGAMHVQRVGFRSHAVPHIKIRTKYQTVWSKHKYQWIFRTYVYLPITLITVTTFSKLGYAPTNPSTSMTLMRISLHSLLLWIYWADCLSSGFESQVCSASPVCTAMINCVEFFPLHCIWVKHVAQYIFFLLVCFSSGAATWCVCRVSQLQPGTGQYI